MALAAEGVWELNASATANNVNGGYFNPANANMATDLAATSANTNSPVVTSASYNFVSGDVGAQLYVKAGTNWMPGWYTIASVNAGAATLTASVGTAIQTSTSGIPNPSYGTNTVAGCATVASPTGGTWTIDYSQRTACNNSTTNDLASSNGTTNPAVVTSASYTFGVNNVGNSIHVNSGTSWTVGWYEIVSVSGGAATLDRAVGSSASISSGVWNLGGAMSTASTLDDDLTEATVAGNRLFVKNGTYVLGEAVSTGRNGTGSATIIVEGYNSTRGDSPTGTNRPLIDCGTARTWGSGSFWEFYNIRFSGSSSSVLTLGTNGKAINCSSINISTTASRTAFAGSAITLIDCQASSCFGTAISVTTGGGFIMGCSITNSNIGILHTTGTYNIIDNIFENCITGISTTATSNPLIIRNNTFYGTEDKSGTSSGINLGSTATGGRITNNIFYGYDSALTTGDITTGKGTYIAYNNYYNNTSDCNTYETNNTAINPSFTDMSQLTGSTATTSSSTLTQSGGDFSTVTDGVDFIQIISGTGVTAGFYPITSHTSNTVTSSIAFGTNATADKVWQITTGHNLGIGTALKATAFPGAFSGSNTIGYLDVGAAQRQEAGGGGGFVGSGLLRGAMG